jgi:hypothetical protein
MSALIEDLQALLNPLAAGGAFYALNTTEPPTYPYIVFQRVASDANVALGGPSVLQNTRVQVDVYSLRIAEASAIGKAVDAAFAAWSVQNVPGVLQDLTDDTTRSYRTSRDYSIWAVN